MTTNQLPFMAINELEPEVYCRILRLAVEDPLFHIEASIRRTIIKSDVGADYCIEDDHEKTWALMVVSNNCDIDLILEKQQELRTKYNLDSLWYLIYQNEETACVAGALQEQGITVRLIILDNRGIPWLAFPSADDPNDIDLGVPLYGTGNGRESTEGSPSAE